MKQIFKRAFCLALVLSMLLMTLLPFSVFAETGKTVDESATESDYVFRETFSSDYINTSGSKANILKDNARGFFACVDNGSTYTLDNGTLRYTSRVKKDYIDIRFYYEELPKDMTEDFTLSFWLKPLEDSLTLPFAWRENSYSSFENSLVSIKNNKLVIGGTTYDNAFVTKDKWSLVEIVFYYDDLATSVSGEIGATTSLSVMLDGATIATVNTGYAFHNVNQFRLFQQAVGLHEIDDLTVSYGTDSLIDVPRTSISNPDIDYLYREEFSKGYVNVQNSPTAIAGVGGLWLNHANGSAYTLENGTLKYTARPSKDYADLRFTLDETQHDLTQSFVLSFWINPGVDKFNTNFAWRDTANGNTYENLFKISAGKLYINGISYDTATVPKGTWSLVEIVFNYDESAKAVTGETGAATSYTFMLNGDAIATVDATIKFHDIDFFRIFSNSNGVFELDDLTVTLGSSSLFGIKRSSAPAVENQDILFSDDFSNGVNTSSDQASINAANGLWLSTVNGTEVSNSSGSMKITQVAQNDYLSLQFYHDETKLDLSRDFILSYKIKVDAAATYRMQWKDHAYSSYENNARLGCNRFFAVNDYDPKGAALPGAYLELGEWALIEIAFHYDEDRIAITGEMGAFSYFTIILNGKRVQTVKTVYDFHTINDFKLLYQSSNEAEIDDVKIATGNKSLAGLYGFKGWEDKQYFFDGTAETDYDYSIAIVGDPQSLTAWNKAGLTTMYDWLKTNANDKKMQFVLGLGDITQYDSEEEWIAASAEISKLNGIVPYAWVRGNHDGSINFNKYLYSNQAYTSQITENGGFYGSGSAETYWRSIQAGDVKYLFIGLDFGPSDAELSWASEIIAAHPDHKVIISTHGYLAADGTQLNEKDVSAPSRYGEAGANDGDDIWNKLGSKYSNVTLIISGHIGSDTVVTTQLKGDNGNVVTQMLVNPQMADHDVGVGMVTMLYFKNGSAEVSVETYSTINESYFLEENQFSFNLNGGITHNQTSSIVYYEDFSSSINSENKTDKITAANGTYLCLENGSTYTLDDKTLKYIDRASGDYIDLRFYYDGTRKDLAKDFVLSFWIKPTTDNLTASFGWKVNATGNAWENSSFKFSNGCMKVGSTVYSNAKLVKDEWSLVELVFNYDGTATAVDGGLGATTSITCYLNGNAVGTAETTYDYSNINHFRILQTVNAEYTMDDLMIAYGSTSLIETLNKAPTEDDDVILFHEDFEDDINTSATQANVSLAKGFWTCIDSGSKYQITDGTLDYTDRISNDYADLRFYYDATKQNLARDFILSFKIKPSTDSLSMKFSWRTHSQDKYESSLEISCGRFKFGSSVYPDAFIKANEWALIEIAFHYNESITSVTGEMGAIDSYTVMLNGEAVQTVNAKVYFHNVDHFRLFRYCNDNYQMDDLIVARGNTSMGEEGEWNGWEPQIYYVDSEPITDFDYSFCVVGDTQKLNRHYPSMMDTLYDWIVNNAEAKKIKFVLGLGDITDEDSTAEWENAYAAISQLNGVVPYSLIRGNHDSKGGINTYFYVNEYTSQFMGFFGEGSMENSWTLLEFASEKYLLLTLDFGPTDAELEWASNIIESYPHHKVIISTHSYLLPDGSLVTSSYSHAPTKYDTLSNDGVDIWNKLASKHENVFLILSGHTSCDYVITSQRIGDHGNTVTEMLIDPQAVDGELSPSGLVTMLYFSNDGKTIYVQTYSTVKEKFFLADNQYNVDISNWASEDFSAEHDFAIPNSDANHHWNECACGAVGEKTEHSYTEANSDATHHWGECSCGAVGEKTEHSYTEVSSDATHHWGECSCGAVGEKTEHEFGEWIEKNGERTKSCACGHTEKDLDYIPADEKDGIPTGAIIGIAIGAVAILGFFAYWFIIRKRKMI